MMMSANDNPLSQPSTTSSSSRLPSPFTLGISSESLVASLHLEPSSSPELTEGSSTRSMYNDFSFNLDDTFRLAPACPPQQASTLSPWYLPATMTCPSCKKNKNVGCGQPNKSLSSRPTPHFTPRLNMTHSTPSKHSSITPPVHAASAVVSSTPPPTALSHVLWDQIIQRYSTKPIMHADNGNSSLSEEPPVEASSSTISSWTEYIRENINLDCLRQAPFSTPRQPLFQPALWEQKPCFKGYRATAPLHLHRHRRLRKTKQVLATKDGKQLRQGHGFRRSLINFRSISSRSPCRNRSRRSHNKRMPLSELR